MTNPLDAEADQIYRDCCRPGLSIRDTAQAAIRTALEMRDAERAEVERLKRSVSQALFELSPDRDTHSQAKCRAARDILQIALRRTRTGE